MSGIGEATTVVKVVVVIVIVIVAVAVCIIQVQEIVVVVFITQQRFFFVLLYDRYKSVGSSRQRSSVVHCLLLYGIIYDLCTTGTMESQRNY